MTPFIANNPVDLIAVVPYLLGFHPEDSVVVMTFGRAGAEGERTFHLRVDLPVTEDGQRALVKMLRGVLRDHRVERVAVLVYSSDVAASLSLHDLLLPALAEDAVEVVDALRVDVDRFHALGDPDDPGVGYELAEHRFTAEQVVIGRVAYPSRAALRDSLVGTDHDDLEAVRAVSHAVIDDLWSMDGDDTEGVLDRLDAEARWIQRTLRAQVTLGRPLGVADAARLLVLVSFQPLREVAWAEITAPIAQVHVEFWRGLLRRSPENLRPGAATLLAFAAWLHGDGALAWCALDRCLEVEPEDAMAEHVAALLESATPPTVWAPIRPEELSVFRT